MKSVFMALPSVFVLGVLIGGWGAREELARDRANAEKEKVAARRDDGRRIGLDAFTRALNLPDRARRPVRAHRPPSTATNAVSAAAPAARPQPNEASRASSPTNAPRWARMAHGRVRVENLAARIEEAKGVWRTRVEIARANAVKKLGLDAKGEKAFDEAVARMNAKLSESVATVAERIANESDFTPELGVRLMGDLGISLAETYDEIGAAVDENSRAEVSGLNLVDFVDPSVAEPLVGVQDKLARPSSEAR